jgi:hypothetical protein
MPSAQPRIRGQETATSFAINNVPQISTRDIRSLELAFKFETQSEGYLGETTERKDSIFKGISGKEEFHFENNSIFGIVQSFLSLATRRVPGIQINTKTTINFATGAPTRMIVPNIYAGEIPFSFSDRASFVTVSFPFEAETIQFA